MRASIAISAYNEGDLLWKTVRSCVETTRDLECEIVVADDASTDDSIDKLRRRFPDVQVVSSPERRGCPATKDLAARSSQGDVIIFLDAHCKPEPGAIARMVDNVERWEGEVIIVPRLVELDTQKWECGPPSAYIGRWLDLEWFRGGWLRRREMRLVADAKERLFYEQYSLSGCGLAVSRGLYAKLRGFDRNMLTWGLEDVDFALKCWLMGHSILVDPEPIIGHRFSRGLVEYPVPFEHLLHNGLRMARKNFDDTAWQDWCWRHRAFFGPKVWADAWTRFEQNRASIEEERQYLLTVRSHSIYQYAIESGLAWPLTLSGSPYPLPAVLKRPRFSCPYEDTAQVWKTSHGPPCNDNDEEGGKGEKPSPKAPTRARKVRGRKTQR
jgi:GT2 family glycosyltransferase